MPSTEEHRHDERRAEFPTRAAVYFRRGQRQRSYSITGARSRGCATAGTISTPRTAYIHSCDEQRHGHAHSNPRVHTHGRLFTASDVLIYLTQGTAGAS